MQLQRVKLAAVLTVSAVKTALIPSYHSTDFEVHRNWLAITSSLPTSQWYTASLSEWTLDYPPLFAWLEYFLAQVARAVDPHMLQVDNLDYASPQTILFQRCSVILTDFVLISGAWYATRNMPGIKGLAVFVLIIAHPGLFIVDHIHFQYNGVLLGLLIWSVALLQEGRSLAGAAVFTVLVNMKHLFAALGPVYFVFLLRSYCRGPNAVAHFAALGTLVAGICAVSFGPFIAQGQLFQVLARLFPFGRGLTHAYWAANIWALYTLADKVSGKCLGTGSSTASATGGMVGTSAMTMLPDISPKVSTGLVLASMMPALVLLWRKPSPGLLPKAVAYMTMCSFMLGYHVHEKAILTVLIPLALTAADSRAAASSYLFASTVGTYALFPLLFTAQEYPIKVLLLVAYTMLAIMLLGTTTSEASQPRSVPSPRSRETQGSFPVAGSQKSSAPPEETSALLNSSQRAFLCCMVAVELYCSLLHPWLGGGRYPFLPLLLVSVYGAAGLSVAWIGMGRQCFGQAEHIEKT